MKASHPAAGVPDHHRLLRAELPVGDDERPKGVVRDEPAGVPDDVCLARLEPQQAKRHDAGVHAGDDGEAARGWCLQIAPPEIARELGVRPEEIVADAHPEANPRTLPRARKRFSSRSARFTLASRWLQTTTSKRRSAVSRCLQTSRRRISTGCSRPPGEVEFPEGASVLERGQLDAGLHVIVEGEASVVLEDEELAVLPRGSFFGEISSLLGEPVVADVVARSPLRCLVIPTGRGRAAAARASAGDATHAEDRGAQAQVDGRGACLRHTR